MRHAQFAPEQVGPPAHVEERGQPRDAERDADRALTPCPPPAVADDDAEPVAEMRGELFMQSPRGGIRIARQQQHGLGCDIRLDIGAIDARIRHDEAEPVLDDQHARPLAHHAPRFREDDFDQTRILVHLGGEFCRARRGANFCEIDVTPFRLGHDFLRHDDNVAVRRRQLIVLAGADHETGKVIARPDHGNVGKWRQRDHGRPRLARPPLYQ